MIPRTNLDHRKKFTINIHEENIKLVKRLEKTKPYLIT